MSTSTSIKPEPLLMECRSYRHAMPPLISPVLKDLQNSGPEENCWVVQTPIPPVATPLVELDFPTSLVHFL
jgi:hypothetical protein